MKRKAKIDVSMTHQRPSGAWECAAIVDGCRVARVYYGYTKREARRLFIEEVSETRKET